MTAVLKFEVAGDFTKETAENVRFPILRKKKMKMFMNAR